jgi:hypothetical protein
MNALISMISNLSKASKIWQTRVIDEVGWASFIFVRQKIVSRYTLPLTKALGGVYSE